MNFQSTSGSAGEQSNRALTCTWADPSEKYVSKGWALLSQLLFPDFPIRSVILGEEAEAECYSNRHHSGWEVEASEGDCVKSSLSSRGLAHSGLEWRRQPLWQSQGYRALQTAEGSLISSPGHKRGRKPSRGAICFCEGLHPCWQKPVVLLVLFFTPMPSKRQHIAAHRFFLCGLWVSKWLCPQEGSSPIHQ